MEVLKLAVFGVLNVSACRLLRQLFLPLAVVELHPSADSRSISALVSRSCVVKAASYNLGHSFFVPMCSAASTRLTAASATALAYHGARRHQRRSIRNAAAFIVGRSWELKLG